MQENAATPGTLYVSVFAAHALPSGTPQLLNLAFQVNANATDGTAPISIFEPNVAGGSRMNEGNLTLTAANGGITVQVPPTATVQVNGVLRSGRWSRR